MGSTIPFSPVNFAVEEGAFGTVLLQAGRVRLSLGTHSIPMS